jgi:uncharacterized membrane protein YqjE
MEMSPETETESDLNLTDTAKRVARRLMVIGQNRVELLMLEMQEERERAQLMIVFAVAAAVLGLLAGMTITAIIALAAGSHFLAALIILAVLYAGGALLLYFKLTQMQRDWEALSATRDQLKKDRECLEKELL